MKSFKLVFSVLALLVVTCTTAYSQYNVVKVDALGLVRDRLYVGFERSFLKQFSVGVAYEKNVYGAESVSAGEYELSSQGFIPEVRYYPFHKRRTAPLGFFVGPAFRYAKLTEEYTPGKTEIDGSVFNYGLVSGYKFRYKFLVGEALLGYGSGKISDEFMTASRAGFSSVSDPENFDDIKRNIRLEIAVGVIFPKVKTRTSGKY